ncbi:hypothetical protein [Streptomyces sp. H62]
MNTDLPRTPDPGTPTGADAPGPTPTRFLTNGRPTPMDTPITPMALFTSSGFWHDADLLDDCLWRMTVTVVMQTESSFWDSLVFDRLDDLYVEAVTADFGTVGWPPP